MCLAVPGCILSIYGDDPVFRFGKVDFGGVAREINLAYVPQARAGDHVLVHLGFALTVVDEAEAERIFAALREVAALDAAQRGTAP